MPNPRLLRSSSTRNSFDPKKGRNFTNYGFDQRLQIPEPHFDKFPTQLTFACWKIRFKTELCSCSKFPPEAMLWIKEIEMATSADDLKSSRSIQGISPFPDFELLDAGIASSRNTIIQNSFFEKKVSLDGGTEGSESRPIPSRKTDRLLDLRILPGHWRQRFCARLCRRVLFCSSE